MSSVESVLPSGAECLEGQKVPCGVIDRGGYSSRMLVVLAQTAQRCGSMDSAKYFCNEAIHAGSEEAFVYRGLLKAGEACDYESGSADKIFLDGLDEALSVTLVCGGKSAFGELKRILDKGAARGFINTKTATTYDEVEETVGEMDVIYSIRAFVLAGDDLKVAALENLHEVLGIYLAKK